jgi:O-antigen/teichoic acid export membrane protein
VQAGSVRHSAVDPTSSLRSGFAWTLAGNALFAASQWALLSLLAKLGGREMLGHYALAVALTAPVAMLAHLNLRAVLATDVEGRHAFADYLAVRYQVSALGLAAIAVVALLYGRGGELTAVILLAGLAQTADTLSDAFYGAMQRRDRMDLIARSMIARGLLSASAFGLALWATRNLVASASAMVAARFAVLLIYDRSRAGAPVGPSADRAGRWAILRQALPLGAVLMLVSLNTNLPRYAIEHSLGVVELGAYAAVASFITAGSTVVNALGQAATPRLARHAASGQPREFLRLVAKLGAVVLCLGVSGVALAILAGRPLLTLAYRPEYAAYTALLTGLLAAAIPAYLAAAMGYAVTAARSFDAQVPLFCVVAAVSGCASFLLVPRYGLTGAAIAVAIAAVAQIAGQGFILGRAVRRMEVMP